MTEAFPENTPFRATLTALFPNEHGARHAAKRLEAAGTPQAAIRMISNRHDQSDLMAELQGFFLPLEDRQVYANGVAQGHHLLIVTERDAQSHARSLRILEASGPADTDAIAAAADGGNTRAATVLPDGIRGTTRDRVYTDPHDPQGDVQDQHANLPLDHAPVRVRSYRTAT